MREEINFGNGMDLKNMYIGVALFAAVLVVAYGMGSDAPILMADGTEYTDAGWLKLADMTLYAIYFLVAVAGISTLVNLSGIFKK